MGKICRYTEDEYRWALCKIEYSESKEYARLNARIISNHFSFIDDDVFGCESRYRMTDSELKEAEKLRGEIELAKKIIELKKAREITEDLAPRYIKKILKNNQEPINDYTILLKKSKIKILRKINYETEKQQRYIQ